jgi:hypothetical protein
MLAMQLRKTRGADFPPDTRIRFTPVTSDEVYVAAERTRDRLNQIGLRADLDVDMSEPIPTGELLTRPASPKLSVAPSMGALRDADLTALDHPLAPTASPELDEWLRQPDWPTSRQYFLDHREGLRASTRVLRELAALSTSNAGLAVHQALMTLDAHDPPEAHDLLDAGYHYLSPSAPPDRKDLLTNLIGTAKADVLQAFTALADRVLAQARLDENADVETLESEEAVAEVLKIVRNILQGAEGTRVLAAKFVVSLSGTRKVSLVQQLLDLITVMHQHEAELTILAESMIVACPPA